MKRGGIGWTGRAEAATSLEIAASEAPTVGAAAAEKRPGRAKLVVLLGALSAFGPLSLDMHLPGLPALRRDLDTGASQAQPTLSACLLGLALGQLAAGPLSDARGRRVPLAVGLAGYAVASLLCALAPSIGALVALRFAQRFAGAVGVVQYAIGAAAGPLVGVAGGGTALPMALVMAGLGASAVAAFATLGRGPTGEA